MKKIIALLTSIALVTTCFAGCKKTDTTSSDVDLSVGVASSEINSNESDNESSNTDSTNSGAQENAGLQNTTVNNDVINYTISYHADSYSTVLTNFNTEYWKMPYAKEDDGSMVRDGYVLLGYSFNADGNGELIRPGYKYVLPSKNGNQDLYCVWAKETNPADFKTIQKTPSSVYISSYTGKDGVVYIPRKIGGKTVTGIAENAFKQNKHLTEVHITPSVREVEVNAFASCEKLKTVTMYDNLQKISDASFASSPVKTVRICAARQPSYANYYGVGIKYERLVKTWGQKRIIVVASSSALYGIKTDYMESLFEDDYSVVNYGTNGNMNIVFFLDAIAPLLSEKDIVVFSPEQYGPYVYHTNGNPEIPGATFQGLASCYNLFENIDASKYTGVFDGFAQYCVQSLKMPVLSWQDHDQTIDEKGDHATIPNTMNSPDYRCGTNGYFRFNEEVIPGKYINNLNRAINTISGTGAKILFSYPPHNKNNIESSSLNERSYDYYNKWISETVNCPLISDIRNYIYNGEYFSNTDYHVNSVGRRMHTKQVAEDIINAHIGVK